MVQCLELLIGWRRFVSGWLVMANTCHYWQMTGLWCSVWSWGTLDCCVADLWWPTLVTIDRWRGYGAVFGAADWLTATWKGNPRLLCGWLVMANTCHYWQMTGLWCSVWSCWLIDGTLLVADLWWPTLVTIDRWQRYGAVVWSCWLIDGDMKGEPSTVVWLTCDGQHLSL